MTFSEFRNEVTKIKMETFESKTDHPVIVGLRRAQFKEQQLKRLIAVATGVKSLCAERQLECWTRQLKQAKEATERFTALKKECSQHKLVVTPPDLRSKHDQAFDPSKTVTRHLDLQA